MAKVLYRIDLKFEVSNRPTNMCTWVTQSGYPEVIRYANCTEESISGVRHTEYSNMLSKAIELQLPKRKVFVQFILSVCTHVAKTLTTTSPSSLKIAQRKMERTMLELSLVHSVKNENIRQKIGVTDTIQRISTPNWNRAGHLVTIKE